MASRSRTSFQKRQKEIARMEKRRDKAARKAQRKQAAAHPETSSEEEVQADSEETVSPE